MLFTIQSVYDLSGFTIESCHGVVSAKISYYGVPSLNPKHSYDLQATNLANRLKSIMTTKHPMNFFIEVQTNGSYYIQNAPIDPRPAIGANVIRVAKNDDGTLTLRVDAPVSR